VKYRKRLTFHLTPLLDLLLIVIFAQYMEVQQAAETSEADLQVQRSQLQAEFQQRQRDQEAAHRESMQAVEEVRSQYSEQYQSILDQHQQAGSALAETFNLPGRLLEETLRLRNAGQAADADRLQQATQELQTLLESRSSELFSFIVRYDEMQKHVSVWELHLLANGQALFTDGKITRRLSFENATEFGSQCFEAAKAFEEPRPLTLILMTFGDTQAGVRRNAIEGFPDLISRLRSDTGGTRWFDYSLMGFRPGGPLMHSVELNPPTNADSR